MDTGIRNGRFLAAMGQIARWIRDRRRFAYFAPGYVVIGMGREEYERLLVRKQREFNYEFFEDDVAQMSDEAYEKLAQRLTPDHIDK